jgi:hypothetical protein
VPTGSTGDPELCPPRALKGLLNDQRFVSMWRHGSPCLPGDHDEGVKAFYSASLPTAWLNNAVRVPGDEDDCEYPLWVLLRADDSRMLRIEHVGVDALSGEAPSYSLGRFQPGVILATDSKFGRIPAVGCDTYVQ